MALQQYLSPVPYCLSPASLVDSLAAQFLDVVAGLRRLLEVEPPQLAAQAGAPFDEPPPRDKPCGATGPIGYPIRCRSGLVNYAGPGTFLLEKLLKVGRDPEVVERAKRLREKIRAAVQSGSSE
jgi:hypothetical protein